MNKGGKSDARESACVCERGKGSFLVNCFDRDIDFRPLACTSVHCHQFSYVAYSIASERVSQQACMPLCDIEES